MHNFKPTDSSFQSEDTFHMFEITHVPRCFAESGSTFICQMEVQTAGDSLLSSRKGGK